MVWIRYLLMTDLKSGLIRQNPEILSSDLSISSDRFSTDKGITVGATVNEVVAAYGDNYVKTGNMYKYYEEGDKYIYFFFLNDTLKYFGCAIDTDNK